MAKPIPDMDGEDLDRAFSTSPHPLAYDDPRIEEDEASYEFMRWRGAESMLRDCGFAELRTGSGEVDFCGRTYRLCHTPHLSFWDPETNPDALVHAFGDLLVR